MGWHGHLAGALTTRPSLSLEVGPSFLSEATLSFRSPSPSSSSSTSVFFPFSSSSSSCFYHLLFYLSKLLILEQFYIYRIIVKTFLLQHSPPPRCRCEAGFCVPAPPTPPSPSPEPSEENSSGSGPRASLLSVLCGASALPLTCLSGQTPPGVFTHLLTQSDASVSGASVSQGCLQQKAGRGMLAWGLLDTGPGFYEVVRAPEGKLASGPPLCAAGCGVAGGGRERERMGVVEQGSPCFVCL